MKKTIIYSAMALGVSFGTINAKTSHFKLPSYNQETTVKVNSFCISIAKGDIEIVKKLLALGEDVNQQSNGMSPAMYAAKYNRTAILELLIANGADLKATSNKNMRAADYAKLHGATQAYAVIEHALLKK